MNQLQVVNSAEFGILAGSGNILAGGDNLGVLNKVTIGSNLSLVSGVLSAVGGGSGSVTSVDLTAPSAFNVSGSPITTSGTLALTAAGVASQYIRGDGTLADFPTSGGGGSSVSYYLNGSVSQGTIGGVVYKQLSKTAVVGTATDFSISADGNIANFITDAGDPSLLSVPSGNWSTAFYFSSSSSGGTPSFYSEIYKYDGTTFTLIGSNVLTPEVITNGTSVDVYYTNIAVPTTTLTVTDRIAIRIYVTHQGRTITLHTQGAHLSQVITTFSYGLTSLNGLSAQVQYFATGTTGTNFNISSSGSTHTFNIPTANNVNRGLLLAADWISFDAKQNSLGTGTTSQYLRGDLTWQTPVFTTSLSALTDVSLTALSNGQYLRYQAGNWINATPTWVTYNLYTADGTLTSNRTITSGGYTLGIAPKTTFNPSVTAASALAQGSIFSPTLVAAANSDVLVGVDISPTFTNGSFTGVSNIALRVTGTITGTSLVKSGGTSSQFLKADGSVDSSAYITRTGISASSPILYNNTTGVISIPVADITHSGYLLNADWISFNAKQNALGTDTTDKFLRADQTWQPVPYPTALSQLSDVTFTSLSNGQLLRYNAGGWSNYTPSYVTANLYTADGTLGSNRTISAGGYTLTINPKTTFSPSITAASLLAQGSIFTPTLTAAANNDVLVGVDITPTFTNGAFTGVSNFALRVTGAIKGSSSVTATSFVKTGAASTDFLKGDGTIDSNAYYLNSNPSSFIARTGISASSPIVYNSTTGVISIPVATLTVSGYLNNADWGSFNAKQNSLGTGTTSQYLRGDLTWVTPTFTTSLAALTDVTLTSLTNGQLLRYTVGGWVNFTPTYVAAGFFSATSPIFYNSSTGVISSQAASATLEGYVTIGTQTIAGAKTFSSALGIGNFDGQAIKLQEGTATGNSYLRFYSSANVALGYLGSFNNAGTQYTLLDGSNTDLSLNGNANLLLQTGGVTRLTISSTGGAVFSSTITAYGTIATSGSGNYFITSGSLAMQLNGSVANDFQLNGGGSFRVINQAYNAALLTIANTGAATFSSSVTAASGTFNTNANSTSALLSITNSTAGALSRAMINVISDTANAQFGVASSTWTADPVVNANESYLYSTNGTSIYTSSTTAPLRFITNSVERMRITSGGNVLIGTTTSAASVFALQVGNGTTDTRSYFNPSNPYAIGVSNSGGNAYYIGVAASGAAGAFQIYSNTTSTANLAITSTGNVLIGKTTSVFGTTNRGVLEINGASTSICGLTIAGAAAGYMYHNGTTLGIFNYLNTAADAITLSNNTTVSGTVTATSFYESSDKRQKTLIEDNFLAKGIETITPKLYTKNDKVELGYYAQDVQGILDGAVNENPDGMLSLSYREVHTAKIYALEKKIEQLETLIKSIIDGNRS